MGILRNAMQANICNSVLQSTCTVCDQLYSTVLFQPISDKQVHLYPVNFAIFLGWSIRMVTFCHQFPLLYFQWQKKICSIGCGTYFSNVYHYDHKTLKSTKKLLRWRYLEQWTTQLMNVQQNESYEYEHLKIIKSLN